MFTIDAYTPARVIFGAGRIKELGSVSLPGKKALLCVTQDGLMEKLGIQKRVTDLLKENGTEYVIFDRVQPNPTQSGVMAAAALAGKENCDFVIGLGGGSSVDTAKGNCHYDEKSRGFMGLCPDRDRKKPAGILCGAHSDDFHNLRDRYRDGSLLRYHQ